MIHLTRLLYCKDEVELMIVDSLLRKQCLNEVLFWVSEYYYSGYKQHTWNIVLKCYSDFYAVLHPTIGLNIFKKYEKWLSKPKIQMLLDVVNTLWKNTNNCDVFLLRMRIQQQFHLDCLVEKKFIGRRPKWITKFTESQRPIVHSLYKRHMQNMIYFIYTLDIDNVTDTCVQYFTSYTQFANKSREHVLPLLKKMDLIRVKFVNDHSDTCQREISNGIKQSILLTMIQIWFSQTDSFAGMKQDFAFTHEPAHFKYVRSIMHHDGPLHTFLRDARKFGISPSISGFDLNRFHLTPFPHPYFGYSDLKTLMWYHWEYFAYNTPIWNKRFKRLNGVQNDDDKMVTFDDADDEYAFSEKYTYEPDEQSVETQSKCAKYIVQQPLNAWIDLFTSHDQSFVENIYVY